MKRIKHNLFKQWKYYGYRTMKAIKDNIPSDVKYWIKLYNPLNDIIHQRNKNGNNKKKKGY